MNLPKIKKRCEYVDKSFKKILGKKILIKKRCKTIIENAHWCEKYCDKHKPIARAAAMTRARKRYQGRLKNLTNRRK